MSKNAVNHIYVHFPFCKSKCAYCGFYSKVISPDDFDSVYNQYITSLAKELSFYNKEYDLSKITSIFVGGGSPSLSAKFIPDLSGILQEALHLDLSVQKQQDYDNFEFTTECNPRQITSDFIFRALTHGVNRFSMGVQSFCQNALDNFGRNQNKDDIFNALDLFMSFQKKGYKFAVSFDLINNLLLTKDQVDSDMDYLEQVLAKYDFIHHISVYDLSFDEGSRIYKDKKLYRDFVHNEDVSDYYWDRLNAIIQKFGLIQYEVSNFAKQSFSCRHNLAYWHYENYIGLGPAAHGTVGNLRIENGKNLSLHNEDFRKNRVVTELTKQEQIEEFLLMNLRLPNEQIDSQKFFDRFGLSLFELVGESINKYQKNDYLDIRNDNLIITNLGINFLNTILTEMFESLDNFFAE